MLRADNVEVSWFRHNKFWLLPTVGTGLETDGEQQYYGALTVRHEEESDLSRQQQTSRVFEVSLSFLKTSLKLFCILNFPTLHTKLQCAEDTRTTSLYVFPSCYDFIIYGRNLQT